MKVKVEIKSIVSVMLTKLPIKKHFVVVQMVINCIYNLCTLIFMVCHMELWGKKYCVMKIYSNITNVSSNANVFSSCSMLVLCKMKFNFILCSILSFFMIVIF